MSRATRARNARDRAEHEAIIARVTLSAEQRARAYAEMRRRRTADRIERENRLPETTFSPLWVQCFDRWRA